MARHMTHDSLLAEQVQTSRDAVGYGDFQPENDTIVGKKRSPLKTIVVKKTST